MYINVYLLCENGISTLRSALKIGNSFGFTDQSL